MSEVMGLLKEVPFKKRLPRWLAALAFAAAESLPCLLGINRVTSGVVYPYPPVFEPVMFESQDGTPLCGYLAVQPSSDPGPSLILAHGLFSSKNSAAVQALALRAYYRWGFHVLALDLRNHGDSSRLSGAPTSLGYRESDDILAAARFLASIDRVNTVAVVGTGIGASSALLAAGRTTPDRPLAGGVVAVNGYARASREAEFLSATGRPWSPAYAIRLRFGLVLLLKTVTCGPRPVTDLRRYIREVAAQYYEISEEELYRKASPAGAVSAIEVPCLIIHSRDDPVIPVAEARELEALASENPMVGVLVAPAGGHAMYQAVSPGWFYTVLETFLRYWGEEGERDSMVENDTMDMYGNPDN